MISPGSYLIVSPLLGYVCVTQLRFQIAQGLGTAVCLSCLRVPGLPQSCMQMTMHQPGRSIVREGAILTYFPLLPVLLKKCI